MPSSKAWTAASLCAAADAAADQGVSLQLAQQARQSAVALAVGADHLAAHHLAVFHIVDLELGGVAEVGENKTILIGNCNSHSCFLSAVKSRRLPAAGGKMWFPAIVARFAAGCQCLGLIHRNKSQKAAKKGPGPALDNRGGIVYFY